MRNFIRSEETFEEQLILWIELALEVSMPKTGDLFQYLVLIFWRFQGLAATELLKATLSFTEKRLRVNLMAGNPGRYRYKGRQPRNWRVTSITVDAPLPKMGAKTETRGACPVRRL